MAATQNESLQKGLITTGQVFAPGDKNYFSEITASKT